MNYCKENKFDYRNGGGKMDENNKDARMQEVFRIFEKLDTDAQNILIAAGSCMLARQQMEEEEKAVS
jgi:hypothetical protein